MKRTAICLSVAAALMLIVTSALAAFKTGTYRGSTGDGHALSFRATNSGLASFRYKSRFHCTDRSTFAAKGGPYNGIRVHNGKFDVTLRNRSRSLSAHLKGKLKNGRASGHISRKARFDRAGRLNPRGTRKCTSNTTWSAKHR